MSFLKDVFQTADEIKQSREKLKDAVDVSSRQAAALIRPYLSEVQNEILSEILEGLVASVAEHSFQQCHADLCRSGGSTRGRGPCATVKQKPPYLRQQVKRL
jgi:hypothetical protein